MFFVLLRNLLFFILSIHLCVVLHGQNTSTRPSIGLTLSGGAAKGLAHIGILKAIDSAGLQIDYISGTSMGAIVGALYAVGYSADSIEKMAYRTDWDLLLSNQSSLRSMIMEEKDEYGKYAIELPWSNNSFILPSGVLEGQELWLRLSELFAPVANVKDFSKFNIPFRCIGTDISNGEAVVLTKGEIVTALRASMAIPSVFTAIDYEGRKLVDGGIVRNFPVRDVKDMGADIVVGSNVATGLFPSSKILNAFQILLQVAFFRESEDRKNELPLCNIYVPMNLEKYTMGSFNQSDEIINIGLEEGRKLFPRLKKLADSLDALYGKRPMSNRMPPVQPSSVISSFEVKGLEQTSPEFFLHIMDFKTNKSYSPQDLSRMVRKAFGTRYYNRVVYSLAQKEDGTSKITFEAKENPLTFSKMGIHYNEFGGISIIANITSRNFILPNSRDHLTVNVGENMRLRAAHLQYLGRLKNFSLILGTQAERIAFTTYDNYKEDGVFKQGYFKFDSRLQYSTRRNLTIGLGTRFEWVHYRPAIPSGFELRGKNAFTSSFVFINYNSLDRTVYPKKGLKVNFESAFVFNQNRNVTYTINGLPVEYHDTASSAVTAYPRAILNFESYAPLSPRAVFLAQAQSGVNFNHKEGSLNEFSIGGLNSLLRNQVTFAGLKEGSFFTPGVASVQAGLRYQLFNNTYLIGRANALCSNFISKSSFYKSPDFLSGYSLTFAYNFALGPLELSAMYCDQSKKVRSYVNIGIAF